MKSYEEVARNVFRRGDEYFRKREKRKAAIKKGVSIMSLFGIITLFGLGMWKSEMLNPVTPENTERIEIIQTADETEASYTSIVSSAAASAQSMTEENPTSAETTVTTTAASTAPAVTVVVTKAAETAAPAVTTVQTDTAADNGAVQTSSPSQTIATAAPVTTTETVTISSDSGSEESKIQVISMDDDSITSEIGMGTGFDYITYYRAASEAYDAYLWGVEPTSFYAVTAETYADLESFKLPEGAELIDLNAVSGTMPSWGWMEQKLCLNELTDPYIIVNGADADALYQMKNVKEVYQLSLYRCMEADTTDDFTKNRVHVIASAALSAEDFSMIPEIAPITEYQTLSSGQIQYVLTYENTADAYSDEAAARQFDLCRTLLELDFVDTAYPDYMYPELVPPTVYTVTLMENTNTDKSFIQGDVDMDGVLTGHDAAMVSRFVRDENYTLTEQQLALADINGDGVVTEADAQEIYAQQIYVLGDADGDGKIFIDFPDDGNAALGACAPYYAVEITPEFLARADVDADGLVTIHDARLILGYYGIYAAGMSTSPEIYGYYFYDDVLLENHASVSITVGDLDLDEMTTKKDIAVLEKYLETGVLADKCMICTADINLDAVIDEKDLAILRENFIDFGCDIDMNGTVGLSDATAVLKMYALKAAGNTDEYTTMWKRNAYTDINDDGITDISDATEILSQYAKAAAGIS